MGLSKVMPWAFHQLKLQLIGVIPADRFKSANKGTRCGSGADCLLPHNDHLQRSGENRSGLPGSMNNFTTASSKVVAKKGSTVGSLFVTAEPGAAAPGGGTRPFTCAEAPDEAMYRSNGALARTRIRSRILEE
jgi:hypothetical protein